VLGQTKLEVSRLCLGTLPMGPLQLDLPIETGAKIIRRAVECGVNFIDTAHAYGTYAHIREGLKGNHKPVIIATKIGAKTREEAQTQISYALNSLGVKQLDIVHLHAARLLNPFKERSEVWNYLVEARGKGIICHLGVATHAVGVVRKAAAMPEVELIHPLINLTGMGIRDGSADDMLKAIQQAHNSGKGIYAMKSLAGGNLLGRAQEAMSYIMSQKCIDAVAVGMLNQNEVDFNVRLFELGMLPSGEWSQIKHQTKKLKILRFCEGCGQCIESCPNEALSLVEGKARVDETKKVSVGR
jgi:aryl-alcohol dehydrogenase-like predicted oxidoreductase